MVKESPGRVKVLLKITALIRYMKGDEYRRLAAASWKMSWPMIFIMAFEFIISLTDVFIAGKLGKEYQAAVGFSMQVYFIFIVVANSLTTGVVSSVARIFSSGDNSAVSDSVYTAAVSAVVAGIFFGIAGVTITGPVVNLLNIPEEVKEIAIPLTRIYAVGLIFHYFLINSNGILRATGNVRKSLATMAVICILNVTLNFYFVFCTPLSFYGIALSTAVSVAAGSIINFIHIKKLISGTGKFVKSFLVKVSRIGWPTGLQQISWQVGGTVLFLILSALPENNVEIIAAFTNGSRIESAIFLPAIALNMANAVIIGNLMGEKKFDHAYRAGLITMGLGVLLITFITVIIVIKAPFLAGLLSDNELVIRESVRYIRISMISEPFMAMALILGGALNGAGDTRGVMVIVVLGFWLVRIPLCYLLGIAADFGAPGVWWSMNISIFVYALFILRRYRRREWLEIV